jgi:hypothetical protein
MKPKGWHNRMDYFEISLTGLEVCKRTYRKNGGVAVLRAISKFSLRVAGKRQFDYRRACYN